MQSHFVQTTDGMIHSILLVDDDPDSAFLLKRDLLKAFPEAQIRAVASSSVNQLVLGAAPDLLVSAYRLQGVTGPELIASLRQGGMQFPIVVVSGMPVYREQALQAGADIFLTYEDAHEMGAQLRPLLGGTATRSSKARGNSRAPWHQNRE